MFFMGLTGAFALAHCYNFAIAIRIPPAVALQLPTVAFVAGAVLGLFRKCREGFKTLVAIGLAWLTAWMLGLAVGCVLIFFGVPTEVADWIPPAFFWLAVALSALIFFAGLHEDLKALLTRFSKKRVKSNVAT